MFDDFQDDDMPFEEPIDTSTPEGLDEPRHSNYYVGSEINEASILNLINAGSMPHALILSGEKGIGKSTFAFRLARALFKHGIADTNQDSLFGDSAPSELQNLNVASDDPIFSKVAAGGHPDFLYIERPMDERKGTRKNNINVETARKVAPFLRMTSADGGWRVVIVDDADTMNRNAQNALLKILEEPPSNALLILITHRLGAMIPTIRSRCHVLNFAPLDQAELTALMTKEVGNSLSNNDMELLNFMAEGSIGRAQNIIQSGGLETAQKILNLFETAPNFNWVDIHHLSEQAGKAGQDKAFKNIGAIFARVYEALTFSKARQTQEGTYNLTAPLNHNVYKQMLARYSLEELTNLYDIINEHFNRAEFSNLDKRQAIVEAFNIIKA